MASLTGQPFPEDVTFHYIPYISDKSGLNQVCGMPVAYKASEGMSLCPYCQPPSSTSIKANSSIPSNGGGGACGLADKQ